MAQKLKLKKKAKKKKRQLNYLKYHNYLILLMGKTMLNLKKKMYMILTTIKTRLIHNKQ